jgi:hypothetical protein
MFATSYSETTVWKQQRETYLTAPTVSKPVHNGTTLRARDSKDKTSRTCFEYQKQRRLQGSSACSAAQKNLRDSKADDATIRQNSAKIGCRSEDGDVLCLGGVSNPARFFEKGH